MTSYSSTHELLSTIAETVELGDFSWINNLSQNTLETPRDTTARTPATVRSNINRQNWDAASSLLLLDAARIAKEKGSENPGESSDNFYDRVDEELKVLGHAEDCPTLTRKTINRGPNACRGRLRAITSTIR